MKVVVTIISLVLCQAALAGTSALPPADEAAAFKAAGFKQHGKQWKSCKDSSASYVPGAIDQVQDINGDGRPEAVITEGSSACFGDTGVGYTLVSKQADGSWEVMSRGVGILIVQKTKGKDGWPDLEIGGPGFCFPVERWNGSEYKVIGKQYEGKPCKR
ncbi:hypothetical protein GM658_15995 [Pseudoduganella eburnea]|uniref:VCBS repeat-containing protein n=1 Tax=Massilia eburnea TaxID=1776165 RepID=A0A6L6QHY8_9BURK|nr:hypothetical protein [Massilia eburnea]MTW12108.1 hypothetical protein [Massilia eburnea]